jgi:hypothetical protein
MDEEKRISDFFTQEQSYAIEERPGAYWENVNSFLSDNWDKQVAELSIKQQAWLQKILDDLD